VPEDTLERKETLDNGRAFEIQLKGAPLCAPVTGVSEVLVVVCLHCPVARIIDARIAIIDKVDETVRGSVRRWGVEDVVKPDVAWYVIR
jgi:hypothetical protein